MGFQPETGVGPHLPPIQPLTGRKIQDIRGGTFHNPFRGKKWATRVLYGWIIVFRKCLHAVANGGRSIHIRSKPKALKGIQKIITHKSTPNRGTLAKVAGSTLQHVMHDPDALAVARVSAARTALELAGDLGANNSDGSEGRHLNELTPGELYSLIDKWKDERILVAKDITPAGSLHSLGD